jgi:hypothetical protein
VNRTKCILDSGVKRTPSPLVVWVVLEKEVDLAILSPGHPVQLQIVLHISSGPVREIRPAVLRYEEALAYEMFIVASEKREPSSSQFPEVRVNSVMWYGTSNTPVIIGTFDTWPRKTEY